MKKRYVIARSYSAGVFAGTITESKAELNGVNVVLTGARRIWYWKGAASLSQLSVDGTSNPSECKFPCEVARVELKNVIEILDVTPTAKKSIAGVPIWEM